MSEEVVYDLAGLDWRQYQRELACQITDTYPDDEPRDGWRVFRTDIDQPEWMFFEET